MQRPRVSVILPMKDAGDTIEEAVASVLAERDVALELVCVDDGSSDDTVARVRAIAAIDPRVRVLVSEGSGIVAALRTGTGATHAPYIGRMDADDLSVPGRFAASVARLDATPSLAVVGTRVRVLLDDPAHPAAGVERHVAWMNELLTEDDHARERFVDSPLCHPSTTIVRHAFDAVGGYRESPYAEDYDLWLRLVQRGFGLAKLEETLLAWRHRPSRLTFTDPRCSHEQLRACKAEHLGAYLASERRPVFVWGAGRDGHRLARQMAHKGAPFAGFIDIDPKKTGRQKLGQRIHEESELPSKDDAFVIVCVGTRGARQIIREKLRARGFVEQRDFLCAA